MYCIWHEMFKIASVSGAPPHTRWGSLRRSPRPPSLEGLLAFGNRSFAPSALAISSTWYISQLLNRGSVTSDSAYPQPRSACNTIDHAKGLSPPPQTKILVTSLLTRRHFQELLLKSENTMLQL